jgi:hypothetical protein
MLRAMEAKASATLNMQDFICLSFCNTFLKKYEKIICKNISEREEASPRRIEMIFSIFFIKKKD